MQQDGRLWKVEVVENPIEIVPVFCHVLCFNLFNLFQMKQVDLGTMNYTCPLLVIFVWFFVLSFFLLPNDVLARY